MTRHRLWQNVLHMGKLIVILIFTLSIWIQPYSAYAESKNRAPGFEYLPKGGTIVIMPTDIELFEMSAGGVLEPKADWSEMAAKNFSAALDARSQLLDLKPVVLSDRDADEIAEINALHAAVARAIAQHHFGVSSFRLPTKEGKLDWSMGDSVRPLKEKTGADYAFFSWIRDSYASGARMATMVVFAAMGVAVAGGNQIGYASLVDLHTGQILWFNQLVRGSGDLRSLEKAQETLGALLQGFPETK